MTSTSSDRAIGVGIVGLSAAGGWAAGAHLPALSAVDGFEVRALVASSVETARAAAGVFDVPHAYDSVEELAGREDVDLVVVSVKVPRHRELVLPAVAMGKAVLCEWPLGNGLAEAEELVLAARGVRSFVGLQGRSSPVIRWLAGLVADGYVGEVLSTTVVASASPWGSPATERSRYLLDRDQGATMLTIPFGHAIDSVSLVLGELVEVSATTAIRREQVPLVDSDRFVSVTAEDQIVVSGTLAGGAVLAAHYRGGPTAGAKFWWEINGTEGTLRIGSESGNLNVGPVIVRGARGTDALTELTLPAEYDDYPQLSGQPSHAVAHAYAAIRGDLAEGTATAPDFGHARDRHWVLDAISRSAESGRRTAVATA